MHLLKSDFANFQFERQIASDNGVKTLSVVIKPFDGTAYYRFENRRRGSISHFALFEDAIEAFNTAKTGG
jgi:hypothetical protein